jgi:hypothetical protein
MDKRYTGMTVNERLYVSGLIHDFDKAIGEKNTDEVIRILIEVDLTHESIEPILEQLRLSK